MICEILQHPHPQLRIVAMEAVGDCSPLVKDLLDTFQGINSCVGLAAPQINIPFRIILVDVTQTRSQTLLMINPVMSRFSEDKQSAMDGCVSVERGKKFFRTSRPKRITVDWTDIHGNRLKGKFTGLIAAVIHHELDHLNGKLFIDYLEAK